MSLRYGSVLASLASLRGRPAIAEVEPSARAVRYRAHDRALADVYVPPRPTGASVLLVHGGAFVIGSRRMKPMRYLAGALHARGLGVCAIDYRLVFRGGGLAEAVDDVTDAIAFWHRHAPAHGLDAARITVAGLSAGGTLALLASARAGTAVHAVASAFGLYELDDLRGAGAMLPYLLLRTGERAVWRESAPLYSAQPAAPTLLLHGTADAMVPVGQAHRLAGRRAELGLPTRVAIYPDAPHGFFNLAGPVADEAAGAIADHAAV